MKIAALSLHRLVQKQNRKLEKVKYYESFKDFDELIEKQLANREIIIVP